MGNIYDLEGNNSEWTGYAVSSHLRDARGGRFNFVADENMFLPASGRTGDWTIGDRCDFCSRVTLYL